ncbi:hypothetical protein [Actinoplanes sp. NPDC051494]|uniref:hypothetical protein n=1 Tax=Actinoplanes sp. NPDC051494 TaxID=3363907 RepID=UPI0037A664D7
MTEPEPYGEEPPAEITGAALARGLGRRLASRYLLSPAISGGLSLLLLAGCILAFVLLGVLGPKASGLLEDVLGWVANLLCFATVVAIVLVIRSFVRGAQSYHVYTGGFVHRKNGRVTAYAWNEIAELKPFLQKAGEDRGKLVHYRLVTRLVTRPGRTIALPVEITDGRDPLLDHLMGMLDQHGIPVS